MGLYEKALARVESKALETQKRSIATLEEYAHILSNSFYYGGYANGNGVQQTLAGGPAESIGTDLTAYAQRLYAENGPVFALMAVRMMAFSGIRFQWQIISGGKPSKLFGNQDLSVLENPWPGGTTQDLLVKMITHADLAGNAYVWRNGNELVLLRPDWVGIVLEPRYAPNATSKKQIIGFKRVGYFYQEFGFNSQHEMVLLPVDEVAHFAPHPDPIASYRGMSWLTPVLREITNDKLMQRHQRKFFENGATPNMVISMSDTVSFDDFKRFKEELKLGHEGVEKAYKTMVIGGGADATVVGANFEQMSFTATQGRGETRLASAAGVPVTIAGFSEGLQGSSLNAGNFAQARRRLADITMAYLWASAVSSLQTLLPMPNNAPQGSIRLWYDERNVPFLREDAKDIAEIMQMKASTLNSLVNSGWTPDSAKAFVDSNDFADLVHTGLLSVQLQDPIASAEMANGTRADSREIADLVHKLYLGVDKCLTWEETRQVLIDGGAQIDANAPQPVIPVPNQPVSNGSGN